MNIATIAALAVTLGLPAPAQQSVTKIITENGQPSLALAARRWNKAELPGHRSRGIFGSRARTPPPRGCQPCRSQRNGGGT